MNHMNRHVTFRSTPRLVVPALLAVAAACFFPESAHAANRTWSGFSSANWSDTGNWYGSVVPSTTGDALFWTGNSTGNLTSVNDLSGLTTYLTFNTGIPGNVSLSGNAITLSTNANATVAGSFTGTATIGMDLSTGVLANATFGLGAGSRLNLNGVISGTLMVISTNGGSVYLNGLNTIAGSRVTNGNAYINTLANSGVAQSLGPGSSISFGFGSGAATGNVIYTGSAAASTNKTWTLGQTRAGIVHNGGFFNDGTGVVTWTGSQTAVTTDLARTFTLGGSNAGNNTWQSPIMNNSGTVPTVNVTKSGAGKWILSAANTYTGSTTVSQGTLLVNGTTAAASAVTVAANAILGGVGTVGGASVVNGIVAPGSGGIGTLVMSSSATWNAGNAWLFELGTPAASLAAATAGTNNDLLTIGGAFIQGTGSSFAFDFANSGADGWYKLVDYASTTFTTGTNTAFTATNLPSGKTATFVVDGSSTALYVQIVPEPGTLALAGLGVGIAGFVGWRRRRL